MSAIADVIRTYYAAFNAKDWSGMLACVTDDVRHDVNEGATRRGRAAFEAFLLAMDRCYDERLEEICVMTSPDQRRAAAEFVVAGVYKVADAGLPEARGQTYRLPAGAFFELDEARIARVTTYYNLHAWLAQVAPAS